MGSIAGGGVDAERGQGVLLGGQRAVGMQRPARGVFLTGSGVNGEKTASRVLGGLHGDLKIGGDVVDQRQRSMEN